jgi:4-amino-4-deoxy-L-arabinose transferase-like glycosyltransferase
MLRVTTRLLPIALVLAFSFSVKIWQLDENPAGFFTDEAGVGYDAYQIAHTGADRYHQRFPLFFRGYACDGVSPYQVYLTVPFVSLFGLTEWSVRLTSVVGSTVELLIFYLLLCQFIPRFHALLGMLILSISPWHFHLSRINMGDYYSWPMMTALSYLVFTKAWRSGRSGYYALAALCFGLTCYSYTPSRMVTPLLFGAALLLVLCRRRLRTAALMAVLFLVTLAPAVHYYLTDPCAAGRLTATTGVSFRPQDLMHPEAALAKLPLPNLSWQQLEHSRVIEKYLEHFNNDFLFKKGDATYPGQVLLRHSIAYLGLLYPYQKWLMLAGVLWMFVAMIRQRRWELTLVLVMILLFPVPDSLTAEGVPFCTRSYLGVLPAHLLIAFGIDLVALCCWQLRPAFLRRPAYALGVAGLVALIAMSFQTLVQRSAEDPLYTSGYWGWQAGPKQVMRYFVPRNDQYDELILSGMFNVPQMFLTFYDLDHRCPHCRIGDLSIYNPHKKQLFALRPQESTPRTGRKVRLSNIYYPNGELALEIFTVDATGIPEPEPPPVEVVARPMLGGDPTQPTQKERIELNASGFALAFGEGERFAFAHPSPEAGQAGTISFEIQPAWNGEEAGVHLFMQIRGSTEWHSRVLILKDGGYLRYLFTGNTGIERGVGVPITSWTRGERHTVTATWHDGTAALYVDGKPVGEDTYQGELEITPRTLLYMGSDNPADPARAAMAKIQSLKIYGRALEPSKVP